MKKKHKPIEIWFRIQKDKDGYPASKEWESLWAFASQHGYTLQSIPFYVKDIAKGDFVEAARNQEGVLEFVRVLQRGGHRTYRVLLRKRGQGLLKSSLRELRALGLEVEAELGCLLAVDVPPEVNHDMIREFFLSKRASGEWGVQDGYVE